jgi:phosphinothricin acetyltransferase
MRIRPAEGTDLSAIVAILNQAVAARQVAILEPVKVEEREEWLVAHTPDKYPILVAESGGEVVGWLSLSDYRLGRRALRFTAEVSYFVAAGHRREGIASALMRAAIDLCPELEIKTLIAILLDHNEASLELLARYSFAEWGRMPNTVEFDGEERAHLYYGLRVG